MIAAVVVEGEGGAGKPKLLAMEGKEATMALEVCQVCLEAVEGSLLVVLVGALVGALALDKAWGGFAYQARVCPLLQVPLVFAMLLGLVDSGWMGLPSLRGSLSVGLADPSLAVVQIQVLLWGHGLRVQIALAS